MVGAKPELKAGLQGQEWKEVVAGSERIELGLLLHLGGISGYRKSEGLAHDRYRNDRQCHDSEDSSDSVSPRRRCEGFEI